MMFDFANLRKTGLLGISSVIFPSLFLAASDAAVINYGATYSNSTWTNENTGRLTCSLVHRIPDYGEIRFVSKAGGVQNLLMELLPKRKAARIQNVTVRSRSPVFRPGYPDEKIGILKYYKNFSGEVDEKTAWNIASDLERGRPVVFSYHDWYFRDNSVDLTVSPIGYKKAYENFLGCMNNLLPFSFEDISFTVLSYERDSGNLTPTSQDKLSRIAEYLKEDKTITRLQINAYTDSYGTASENLKTSNERAEQIKKIIEQTGVDASRIETAGFGEKHHVAPNRDEEGRQHNRRIIISIKNEEK